MGKVFWKTFVIRVMIISCHTVVSDYNDSCKCFTIQYSSLNFSLLNVFRYSDIEKKLISVLSVVWQPHGTGAHKMHLPCLNICHLRHYFIIMSK